MIEISHNLARIPSPATTRAVERPDAELGDVTTVVVLVS